MSYKGSATPLRVDLQPSRWQQRLIVYPHLATALVVLTLALDHVSALLLLPLVYLSHGHYAARLRRQDRWRQLVLHSEGKVVWCDAEGREVVEQIVAPPLLWPGLTILPLEGRRGRVWRTLYRDAYADPEQGHALYLRLRYGLRREPMG